MKKLIVLSFLIFSFSILFADTDVQKGSVRFVVDDYAGNVCVYRVEDGESFALLDQNRFTKSSSFHVNVDGVVYPVDVASGFKIESTEITNGIKLIATLKNKIKLTVNYTVYCGDEHNHDIVRVTSSIVNLSDKNMYVGVKSIFDTSLSEQADAHFSTAIQSSISSETELIMKEEHWVRSSNEDVSLGFIIPDSSLKNIKNVFVANKNIIEKSAWHINAQKGRSFNALHSYNNSALVFTWKTFVLKNTANTDLEFYMFMSNNEDATKEQCVNTFKNVQLITHCSDTVSELEELIKKVRLVEENIHEYSDTEMLSLINAVNNYFYETQAFLLSVQSMPYEITGMKDLVKIVKNSNTMDVSELERSKLEKEIDTIISKATW